MRASSTFRSGATSKSPAARRSPWGVNFGAVVQNLPGHRARHHLVAAGERVPRTASGPTAETIILSTPGTVFQPRYNQVDINFRKNFRHGNKVFTAQFDLFNVTNSSSILTTNNSIGGIARRDSIDSQGPHAAHCVPDEVLAEADVTRCI